VSDKFCVYLYILYAFEQQHAVFIECRRRIHSNGLSVANNTSQLGAATVWSACAVRIRDVLVQTDGVNSCDKTWRFDIK